MNVAILARYPKLSDEERRPFLSSVLGLLLVTTLGAEALFLLIASLFGRLILSELTLESYLLVMGISAAETMWLFFATVYRAEGAAWQYITASAFQSCVSLVLTLVLIARLGCRENGLLYGRLIADAGLMLLLARKWVRYRPSFRLGPAIALSKVGLPMVPATFASMWVTMSPRFFLERFGTTADVGQFAIDSKLAGVVSLVFVQPFAMAWMAILPRIAHRDDAKRAYGRVITLYVLAGGTVALAMAWGAPLLAQILGRDNFTISPSVILLLSFATVAMGLMYPVNIGPYVREQTTRMMPVFVASMALSLPAGWIFVRAWGVTGAALELLLVYLIQGLVLGYVSQRMYPVTIEWSRIARVLVVLVASHALTHSLVGAALPWWGPPLQLALLVGGTALTRVISVEELRLRERPG
jgi:O-antigen/teichoic acid export membrane protein